MPWTTLEAGALVTDEFAQIYSSLFHAMGLHQQVQQRHPTFLRMHPDVLRCLRDLLLSHRQLELQLAREAARSVPPLPGRDSGGRGPSQGQARKATASCPHSSPDGCHKLGLPSDRVCSAAAGQTTVPGVQVSCPALADSSNPSTYPQPC